MHDCHEIKEFNESDGLRIFTEKKISIYPTRGAITYAGNFPRLDVLETIPSSFNDSLFLFISTVIRCTRFIVLIWGVFNEVKIDVRSMVTYG